MRGRSAMNCLAVLQCNSSIGIQILHDHGASVDEQNLFGMTPMMMAITSNNVRTLDPEVKRHVLHSEARATTSHPH